MDPEVRDAWRRALLRLAVGAVLMTAVLGLRILTAPAPESEAGARIDPLPASPSAPKAASAEEDPEADGSFAARLGERVTQVGDRVRESLSGAEAGRREGERIVSCRLEGTTQFMRSDDCTLRGGRSDQPEGDR